MEEKKCEQYFCGKRVTQKNKKYCDSCLIIVRQDKDRREYIFGEKFCIEPECENEVTQKRHIRCNECIFYHELNKRLDAELCKKRKEEQ